MLAVTVQGWVTLIGAVSAGITSIVTAVSLGRTRRDLRPPHGGTLAAKVEEVHELAVTTAAAVEQVVANGSPATPAAEAVPPKPPALPGH